MVRGDLTRSELAHEIERSELLGVRAHIAHAQVQFPELEPELLEVAGGIAAFAGAGSPISEACGIAIFSPARDGDVAELVRFYTERGAIPRVMVGPMTDPAFPAALARNGFVPVESQNVYAIDLGRHRGARDARIREARDAGAWAELSVRGFFGGEPVSEIMAKTIELVASRPGVWALEAYDGDRIVGSGGVGLNTPIPYVFGASVLPEFRGRGWQSVLIDDRVARAAEHGARYARANARPFSASERNFVNAGFVVLYTRVCWEWHFKNEKG